MNKEIHINPRIIIVLAIIAAFIIQLGKLPYNVPLFFYIPILFFMYVLVIPDKRCINYAAAKNKRKKGAESMKELAKNFIGKECLLSAFNGTTLEGVVKEVSGNALLIDNNGNLEAVNLEYITRIREYPKNKKGKKKSIILD